MNLKLDAVVGAYKVGIEPKLIHDLGSIFQNSGQFNLMANKIYLLN